MYYVHSVLKCTITNIENICRYPWNIGIRGFYVIDKTKIEEI